MFEIKYLVTSALPYVNFELHLGHFAGCLLPADVYYRFLKLKGENAVYVSGTDEYGTPSLVAAEKEGIKPKELVDRFHAKQEEAVKKFNLALDIYSGTTSPEHTKVVQDFYHKIKQKNYTYTEEVEQLYCETCSKALPDRYVVGTCPNCGYEKARGDQCEHCGKLLDPLDLQEPRCIVCGNTPIVKKSEHLFFELSKLEDQLGDWITGNTHWPANARNFALSWIKEGLDDRDISRDMSWGVPIPDLPGKVFYVWFDAPLGYITFSRQISKEAWWHDKNTKIVHFLGKDNIPFHTIFFPGMLIAAGGYTLPFQIASYEYLNYEGGKFSKSENRGVFALEALELFPADYWRYVIIALLPERHDSDFTWEGFREIVNNDLNDALGNFVHRTLTFTKRFCGGKVPKPGALNEADNRVLKEIKHKQEVISQFIYDVKLRQAAAEAVALARLGNEYLSAEEPWKNKERQPQVIYVSLQLCKALSVYLEPFIPGTAAKLREFLGVKKARWEDAVEPLAPGSIIHDFEPLFRKVEEKEVAKYKESFGGGKKQEKKKGGKPMVKYDDFAKLELKVGEIKKAEKVEGADKLVKLEVDTGELRTLVAGIAPYYDVDELVGKRVIVLTNLEPRKVKGIESQGMVLAAVEGDNVSLLTVDKAGLKPGAEVE